MSSLDQLIADRDEQEGRAGYAEQQMEGLVADVVDAGQAQITLLRTCVPQMTREQALQVWREVNALQRDLCRHTNNQLEAYAAGYAAGGGTDTDGVVVDMTTWPTRNQAHAERAVQDACPYCGANPCEQRDEHERLDAGNEVTWLRKARSQRNPQGAS